MVHTSLVILSAHVESALIFQHTPDIPSSDMNANSDIDCHVIPLFVMILKILQMSMVNALSVTTCQQNWQHLDFYRSFVPEIFPYHEILGKHLFPVL